MYQAQTIALQQTANQQLVDIRQSELDYFTGFFSNFGTQAALLGGFVLSSYTNINASSSQYGMRIFV